MRLNVQQGALVREALMIRRFSHYHHSAVVKRRRERPATIYKEVMRCFVNVLSASTVLQYYLFTCPQVSSHRVSLSSFRLHP